MCGHEAMPGWIRAEIGKATAHFLAFFMKW